MKIIRKCTEDEVWNHWKNVECWRHDNFRGDIRGRIPKDIIWYLAEIEREDLKKLFIISSDDWRNITSTFQLLDVVNALNAGKFDEKIRKICMMRMGYQHDLDCLDRRYILVSPSIEGNFTIIEGNKRATALLSIGKLVGNQVYLGISNEIKNFLWARYST